MLGQSKNPYQAEIDAACEIRRLPALQRLFRQHHLQGAADVVGRRHQQDGIPAAGGIRVRGVAVQLHGHRLQPQHGAGAHGQHHGVETGHHRDPLQLLPDENLPGGGPARWGRQLPAGPGIDHRRRGLRPPRPGRHPFHRLHRHLQPFLARTRRKPAPLQELPAHRRRNRRQGFHCRASLGPPGRSRRGDGARRLRVSGTEMFGGLPRLYSGHPLAGC